MVIFYRLTYKLLSLFQLHSFFKPLLFAAIHIVNGINAVPITKTNRAYFQFSTTICSSIRIKKYIPKGINRNKPVNNPGLYFFKTQKHKCVHQSIQYSYTRKSNTKTYGFCPLKSSNQISRPCQKNIYKQNTLITQGMPGYRIFIKNMIIVKFFESARI